ncbi:SET domain protein [Ophiocordyceps sinensis CO18]|nr:SET domain protein [Ophiocordyceps sinensis CO18]
MPSPMYTGLRTLIAGRDFKLPYNVCNPLPPGQPKPDEWKRMTKNRFIGDSKDYWRKTPHMHDYQSKCVCTPDEGCGESCQNRIMLYECDATNCNVGKQHCANRAFADLTTRRAKGGKYRVGVEVIKTSDRGYGVRSNRCFRPNQIIMEYAGEIITEEECERRMNEVYKDNECYYLMSFDQNMIIDATTGSIARFVNHSCNPNCRMIKWIVSGQPRMALFAGDRPIMTGEELTYDYNFDPFSAKNVQSCLCGEPNCRGVLGPKPREVKAPKTDLRAAVKATVKATVKAGKRKLKELVGGDEADTGNAKKRSRIRLATKATASLSSAGLKAAKGAAAALASTISVGANKAALGRANAPAKRTAATLIKKTSASSVVKTYRHPRAKHVSTSRASSLTIFAMGDENDQPGQETPSGNGTPSKASSPGTGTPLPKTKTSLGKSTPSVSAASARKPPKAKIQVVSR